MVGETRASGRWTCGKALCIDIAAAGAFIQRKDDTEGGHIGAWIELHWSYGDTDIAKYSRGVSKTGSNA